ncbi:hypothetical protein B0H14DRAFT_2572971 [Mycena olivaceomarginata]|nr:hypothetical protein B0H14DRAFT_2572971 [Mycena olivaceomarginata]
MHLSLPLHLPGAAQANSESTGWGGIYPAAGCVHKGKIETKQDIEMLHRCVFTANGFEHQILDSQGSSPSPKVAEIHLARSEETQVLLWWSTWSDMQHQSMPCNTQAPCKHLPQIKIQCIAFNYLQALVKSVKSFFNPELPGWPLLLIPTLAKFEFPQNWISLYSPPTST